MGNKKEVDDRFRKFGIVGFTAVTGINDFIDHLEQGKVTGTRCKQCALVFFPPRADCYQCLSSDMEWYDVTGHGTLVTYSTLNYAPAGFDSDVPYTVALLDFGDYRVFGRIAGDVDDAELKIGKPMKIVVNRLPEDRITYEFRNVKP